MTKLMKNLQPNITLTNNTKAILWMIGTLTSFSLMATSAREISHHIPTQETLFIRSIIGLLCISALIIKAKGNISIRSNRLGLHSVRNIFHFGGQYGWFMGIGLLPLAEVFALEFTVPIWTMVLATIALNEKVTLHKVLAILLGSMGVLVILKPGIAIIDTASFIVLGAAICYAVAHTSTKALSSSEHPITILFYMCLIQLPIGLLLSLKYWIMPVGVQWLWLGIIGITALSAHYCMVKAMQYAEATTVTILDFLRLPLIALVGVLLYSEKLEISLIIGGLLMLVGNMISLQQGKKT